MFIPFPPGTYRAEVTGQGFDRSSVKGTRFFYLTLTITHRTDGADCPRGQRTYRQYLANDTGAGILHGDLKALGVEVADITQLEPGTPGHVSLAGRQIEVDCQHELHEGQTWERWRIHRPRGRLDAGEVRELSDRFGHIFRKGAGQPGRNPGVENPNDSDRAF
jgi:hypothetical protein